MNRDAARELVERIENSPELAIRYENGMNITCWVTHTQAEIWVSLSAIDGNGHTVAKGDVLDLLRSNDEENIKVVAAAEIPHVDTGGVAP